MKTDKWLITGGAGYIGTALANGLHDSGFQVEVIDNFSIRNSNLLSNTIKVHNGDVRDRETLRKSLQGCFGVIHLAANKSVSESLSAPMENIQDNIMPLLTLLSVMREEGIDNLIFSSSAAVYGNVPNENQPIKENEPLNPSNAYGTAKAWCEDAIRIESKSREYLKVSPLKSVVMRYFNVVGVFGNSTDISESGLFSAIRRHYQLQEPIKIFGKRFNSKDGTAVRDYLSLADLVEAHKLLLSKWRSTNESTATYNLATSNPTTVLDVVREFEAQSSRKLTIEFLSERTGEIPYSQGDNSAFKEKFSWSVKYELDKIVGDLLRTF